MFTPSTSSGFVSRCAQRPAYTLCAIHTYRDRVWHLEARLRAPRTRYGWSADVPATSAAYRVWVRHLWYTRWKRWTHRATLRPWTGAWLSAALCVHHYEGAWNSDTGNGYYGGLQFDLATWAANGGQGLPNIASPVEQLLIAYHTWQARGWEPWPNTAAMCGLL